MGELGYIIVGGDSASKLADRVNTRIKEGYVCQGGVYFSRTTNRDSGASGSEFYQAMIHSRTLNKEI